MKKIVLALVFCAITIIAKAQDASVEKSLYGIQTGPIGIWGYNETKLTNSIALRSEIGIEAGFSGGSNYNGTYFVVAPSISLAPRWYYNLKKREGKSKRIDGNSGNFVSLKTSYQTDLELASNDEHVDLISDITIIPTWGIRRNIGKHFNYEAGFGIGYIHYFKKDNVRLINEADVAVNAHARIGYTF
ncbi:hypothetical protein [Lacinutrix himadriensis]|uniref:hypothetical protein n=1 Tax=Lacinutrix himadriensis TaxID=641549 RepID=UPI0006E3BC06|nr:hypothetical protein [Lacinutrix himadriensis]